MLEISRTDILKRLQRDNPWWVEAGEATAHIGNNPRRAYFPAFYNLSTDFSVRRATILLGPRRVGKTVMLHQLIDKLMKNGFSESQILYCSIDAPVYSGMLLESFLELWEENADHDPKATRYVIFDEIQYLKDWGRHLKDLVDSHRNTKFIASGSAAAALKLKSDESGAGRFSDFLLPPLTFHEYLNFLNLDHELLEIQDNENFYRTNNIDSLNSHFVDYLNYGGYPESVLSETIRRNADQFIKNDIIDKVLLKDLPALYGIRDIQELNRLFSVLAYNSGQEVNLESLSQQSGVSKPTLKKYIEYLTSAFLITKVSRIDENCKQFARERNFKVYLTNPSMRAALFSPVEIDDNVTIGHLAESGVFAQWMHSSGASMLHFARFGKDKEIDIVALDRNSRPRWAVEVKWSDRAYSNTDREVTGMIDFLRKHTHIKRALVTSKTQTGEKDILNGEVKIDFVPTAAYCYTLGINILSSKNPV